MVAFQKTQFPSKALGNRDSILVEGGSKRLTPAAEVGVFFSFVLFFGNLILQCLNRLRVLAAAKTRELYGNHIAKKKQEKLQLGHFQFLDFLVPGFYRHQEIGKKRLNLKQKSVQTRCRTLVSTAHLPCHACLPRKARSVHESGKGH